MSNSVFALQVSPSIPSPLQRLDDLAKNFWFSWNPALGQLFRKLDPILWRKVEGSPRLFLRSVDQSILDRAATDAAFIDEYRKIVATFDEYLGGKAAPQDGLEPDDLIAYFCAEYGWHESFPIYSGGLGVLAGDHCKTASDLNLPFVAVGLLYRHGYFHQSIDRNGQQVPDYPPIDPRSAPLSIALHPDGSEVRVTCPALDRNVVVRVWKAPVGRVTVLLLDTDVPENVAEDRLITGKLYGGSNELRQQQEAVLGIGGVRALRALGLKPTVWHINEGHAAFLVLERAREYTTTGLPFSAAIEATAANTVFTTHTPVSAGHDVFPPDRVARQFAGFTTELGITAEQLLDLGRAPERSDVFNMTRLALRGSAAVNGVSKIHGEVSSRLCASAWPDVPPAENPVGYVTNGVHVATFLRHTWAKLFDQHLGVEWRARMTDRALLARIDAIPDALFWETSQKVKSQMLRVLRERLTQQYQRNGLSEAHIHRLLKRLDPEKPDVLTVGFARRFATYKRATLLMADLRWLEQLVSDEGRPVVFVFAGKAHPHDEPAQWMMREIQRISGLPPFVGKILLVEGYDLALGRLADVGRRHLAQHAGASAGGQRHVGHEGGDQRHAELERARRLVGRSVRRPARLEERLGHTAGARRPGEGERDRQDSTTLYETLQDEVVPLYYARDEQLGYSPEWVQLCKRSMASVLPAFNSERVLRDYLRDFYAPAARHGRVMAAEGFKAARELGAWKEKVRAAWPGVALKLLEQLRPPKSRSPNASRSRSTSR